MKTKSAMSLRQALEIQRERQEAEEHRERWDAEDRAVSNFFRALALRRWALARGEES